MEQVEEVTEGLQRLDYYLTNVTNEQRYLYARTVRHLRTAESTYTRTLAYMLLICATIVAASVVQVGRMGCEGVGVGGAGCGLVSSRSRVPRPEPAARPCFAPSSHVVVVVLGASCSACCIGCLRHGLLASLLCRRCLACG